MSETWFLNASVQAEPLVDRWYAWSHLIPPTTLARNMTQRHFKIMDSYVAAPQVHASAVANPKMLGGPFIDYGGQRVEEIRELRHATESGRKRLVELSDAIDTLSNMLATRAQGGSLEPLYKEVPECLRGYVELTYDLNQQPNFRFFEPLLYRSPFYSSSGQSIMLSVATRDDRPFVLSTPRLDTEGSLHLEIPFADPDVDKIFHLKQVGASRSEVRQLLTSYSSGTKDVEFLMTTRKPNQYPRYEGQGVRWRYYGHACILVETQGLSVLFDPIISYEYDNSIPRYTYADLPDQIDCVVITHNHQDHILFETVLQIRHKVGTFVVPRSSGGNLQDPSLKLTMEMIGCKNVVELDSLQSVSWGPLQVTALPFLGEHADLDIRTKAAFMIEAHGHKLIFAADSCNIEPYVYKHLADIIGPVDALFLGMECEGAPLSWLYGPLLTKKIDRSADQSRRLSGSDYNQAKSIVEYLRCSEVYVYAMGQEPWLTYISSIKYGAESKPIVESDKLLDACQALGIVGERLYGEKEILLKPKGNRGSKQP